MRRRSGATQAGRSGSRSSSQVPLLKREDHDRVRHADPLRKEKGASSVQDLGGADLIEGRVGGQCATALPAFMAIAVTWFL